MKENPIDINELGKIWPELGPERSSSSPINYKRILSKAIWNWYWIVLSLVIAVSIAFLVNRYSSKIYPVRASIIVREGDENVGAKFLYNNSLANPYRNFYNELYILRSYPLLEQVVRQLNFEVVWTRKGNLKTSEFYDSDFPIKIVPVKGPSMPYGRKMGFTIENGETYSLEYLSGDSDEKGRRFDNLRFNDTVAVNGFRFFVSRKGVLDKALFGMYFIINFQDPAALARLYSIRLSATWAEQGASVVNLDINGAIPEKEVDFLNKFIKRYQDYDVEKKSKAASKSIEFLDQQLVSIGDSLHYFENKMEQFKRTNSNTDFEEEASGLYSRISELEQKKLDLELLGRYHRYLEGYISKGNDFDQIVPPSAMGITDEVLSGLVGKLTELQFNIRMLGGFGNDVNPLVKAKKDEIRQIKKDILEGLNSIKATEVINVSFINEQIRKIEKQLMDLPESERALVSIKRNYSIRENLYIFLMQKRAEAGISKASTTSDILVVNPPTPGGQLSPKPFQNYLVAVTAGLLLPILIFILIELLNDKVQSKEDIENFTRIPVIGGIGHSAAIESNLVVHTKPKSSLAESFRALRSNLNYFTGGQNKKVIMITSSVSGEGKTFTTINLATVFASAGNKVLIIGADMRKPKIFSDFGLHNSVGLSTYLSSSMSLDQVIQVTNIDGLHLISGGPVPPNPSELLLSAKVGEMLTELKTRYDYVILDTPPIGLVTDAFPLMTAADHTIFLVRQNHTPRHFLKTIDELFEKRNLRTISILFNDIRKTGPGYGYEYGYGYGYGYNYGYGYGYLYGRKKHKDGGGYYAD